MEMRGLARELGRLILGTVAGVGILTDGPAESGQLHLSWVDNTGGQAYFSIERKAGGGVYEPLATLASGVATYTDTQVAAGFVYCYRVQAYNDTGASGFSNEACGAVAQGVDVSVTVAGSGSVTSSPPGIACGADCAGSYPPGAIVTLIARPAAGMLFAGWSGGGCGGTATCTVTGNGALAVTATFAPPLAAAPGAPTEKYTLTVTRSGSGAVTSAPEGIGCGSECVQIYPAGTTITLKPSEKSGWVFERWSGACSGTGSCTVTLDRDRAVQATFVRRHSRK
jgi:hypothetical protein